jgi:manganese/zinc/iron transport system permease protein
MIPHNATWPTVASFGTEMLRFWSFQDGSVRTAAAGMVLLGICCGLLGSLIVLRRMSLLGDSLGHAVLPGLCLGFVVTWTKHPGWLFFGALLSALVAGGLIALIQRGTRLKPDVGMGLVLSGFFGVGLMILSRIQSDPRGGQGGLNQFFFGQAAALRDGDLLLIGIVTGLIALCVLLLFKEWAVFCFDEGFARALGLPVRRLHYLLVLQTAMSIVIAIQAVGVVLLSALLITPAATALLLTDRLPRMLGIAVTVAVVGSLGGLNLSSLSTAVLAQGWDWLGAWGRPLGLGWPPLRLASSLPTGPTVVLVLAMIFLMAWVFSPRYGMVSALWRRVRRGLSKDQPAGEA